MIICNSQVFGTNVKYMNYDKHISIDRKKFSKVELNSGEIKQPLWDELLSLVENVESSAKEFRAIVMIK